MEQRQGLGEGGGRGDKWSKFFQVLHRPGRRNVDDFQKFAAIQDKKIKDQQDDIDGYKPHPGNKIKWVEAVISNRSYLEAFPEKATRSPCSTACRSWTPENKKVQQRPGRPCWARPPRRRPRRPRRRSPGLTLLQRWLQARKHLRAPSRAPPRTRPGRPETPGTPGPAHRDLRGHLPGPPRGHRRLPAPRGTRRAQRLDVLVDWREGHGAIHGDRVLAEITGITFDGRPKARVVKVLARNPEPIPAPAEAGVGLAGHPPGAPPLPDRQRPPTDLAGDGDLVSVLLDPDPLAQQIRGVVRPAWAGPRTCASRTSSPPPSTTCARTSPTR